MRSAVAIRHVLAEDLGSLAPVLQDHDYRIRYHDAATDDPHSTALEAADLLIVLGGPVSANDEAHYPFITPHLALLRRRLEQKRPTLGLCLGAQMMAKALGARVLRAERPEVGWFDLTLTEAGRHSPLRHLDGIRVLQWHYDRFELPLGATRLAATADCDTQAFAIGDHALATQFHPEITDGGFQHWLIGAVDELAARHTSVAAFREATRVFAPDSVGKARAWLGEWLARLKK